MKKKRGMEKSRINQINSHELCKLLKTSEAWNITYLLTSHCLQEKHLVTMKVYTVPSNCPQFSIPILISFLTPLLFKIHYDAIVLQVPHSATSPYYYFMHSWILKRSIGIRICWFHFSIAIRSRFLMALLQEMRYHTIIIPGPHRRQWLILLFYEF